MFRSAFFKPFYLIFITCFILILFSSCFVMPILSQSQIELLPKLEDIVISQKGYAWPTPGYSNITSYFGKRTSPTAGASSYHKGIDIGAPEGSYEIAICDGEISYIGFLGGGGYTITLTTNTNLKITYCHVSPIFLVEVGQIVKRGDIIARVGPMYIEPIQGNSYTDSQGRQTNGAMTGPHLHLGVRDENDNYLDPLSLYQED